LAGTYAFTVVEGEDFSRTLTWFPDGVTPANLTGYSAQFIVEDINGSPLLVITTAAGSAGTVTLGGAAGTVTLFIPAATIATLIPGQYRLLMTSSGNASTCLLRGQFVKEAS
jgi:hypothetical protein